MQIFYAPLAKLISKHQFLRCHVFVTWFFNLIKDISANILQRIYQELQNYLNNMFEIENLINDHN